MEIFLIMAKEENYVCTRLFSFVSKFYGSFIEFLRSQLKNSQQNVMSFYCSMNF